MPAKTNSPECPRCGIRHRDLTPGECADRAMTEKALQDRIVVRARKAGWKVAHAGRGYVGRAGSGGQFVTQMSPGWPDLCLAREGSQLIFMEIKRQAGKLSEDQWFWMRLLNGCGVRAIVVRPSDLREGRVGAILLTGSPLDGSTADD